MGVIICLDELSQDTRFIHDSLGISFNQDDRTSKDSTRVLVDVSLDVDSMQLVHAAELRLNQSLCNLHHRAHLLPAFLPRLAAPRLAS